MNTDLSFTAAMVQMRTGLLPGLFKLPVFRRSEREALERDWPRVAEVAFDATRRRMAALHQGPG